MINKIKKLKFFCFVFLIFFSSYFKNVYAEKYDEIKILGNDRLSIETIIMFSGLNIKNDISVDDLNESIKNLYKTNYFKNIKITTKGKQIKIEIIENSIIQSIKINGIKNKSILKELQEITKKSEKYPFLKDKIIDQKILLMNLVRNAGFYFAEIDTNVIDNKNNSVDIIYNFNLKNRAIIKKINFQGKNL